MQDRRPLHDIVEESFGVLGELVNTFIPDKENGETLEILYRISKVFYKSN